jgi:hypothetical protein
MVRRVLGLVLIGLLLAWPSFGWVAAAANASRCNLPEEEPLDADDVSP